jgi:hypothetical protein
MATINLLAGTMAITTADSMTKINANFTNLNSDKIETSYIDTDTTLAANSDVKIASQKATKAYVDTLGNVNASTTAKGIVEEATAAEVLAGTAVGATGARLFVNPSTLSSQSSFGSGADGDVTISTPTTLTRDMFYNDLTVSDILTTAGYAIYIKGSLLGSGTITWGTPANGSTPANPSSDTPVAGGAGGIQGGTGYLKNIAGAQGGTATSGGVPGGGSSTAVTQTYCIGSASNAGGTGGTGGNGSAGTGAAGAVSIARTFGNLRAEVTTCLTRNTAGLLVVPIPQGQAPGGGSGCGDDAFSGTGCAGSGGGGGASGGIIFIVANIMSGSYVISAVGGNGGNGAAGYRSSDAVVGGGGGGAGGNGGVAILVYNTKTWAGTPTLTGGAGGTGGAGAGGGAGADGSAGAAGTTYNIPFNQTF